MKLYERLSFRGKLVLQAMLAASFALVLALISLGTYDLVRERQRVADELTTFADLIEPSAKVAIRFDLAETARVSRCACGGRMPTRRPML